jgi:hypothetical protein
MLRLLPSCPHDTVACMADDAPGVSQPFDMDAAQETLRLLQLAHDRWSEVYDRLVGTRFEGENTREEVSLRLRGPAVKTTMWVRALDDWCRGRASDNEPELPGYEDRRCEVEGLLNAARYATNRSLHQLLALMVPRGAMVFPFNPNDIFGTFTAVFWLREEHLPPISSEKGVQLELRKHYVEHMAWKEVGPTLDRLREWFEEVLAASEG